MLCVTMCSMSAKRASGSLLLAEMLDGQTGILFYVGFVVQIYVCWTSCHIYQEAQEKIEIVNICTHSVKTNLSQQLNKTRTLASLQFSQQEHKTGRTRVHSVVSSLRTRRSLWLKTKVEVQVNFHVINLTYNAVGNDM